MWFIPHEKSTCLANVLAATPPWMLGVLELCAIIARWHRVLAGGHRGTTEPAAGEGEGGGALAFANTGAHR